MLLLPGKFKIASVQRYTEKDFDQDALDSKPDRSAILTDSAYAAHIVSYGLVFVDVCLAATEMMGLPPR